MIDEFMNDVAEWIMNWVSVPNKNLGAVPCPFARNALLNSKIHWVLVDNADELRSYLNGLAHTGLPREVVAVGMNPAVIGVEEFVRIVAEANERLLPKNIVGLEDHPNDPEIIHNESMNQGKWALVLLQSLSGLNEASRKLMSQGYYRNWTLDQITDMVDWRIEAEKKNENTNS